MDQAAASSSKPDYLSLFLKEVINLDKSRLTKADVRNVILKCGLNCDDDLVNSLFNIIDKDGEATITIQQAITFFEYYCSIVESPVSTPSSSPSSTMSGDTEGYNLEKLKKNIALRKAKSERMDEEVQNILKNRKSKKMALLSKILKKNLNFNADL